ncbi:MAG: DsbA family protein [Thermomicrobiales bacterium]
MPIIQMFSDLTCPFAYLVHATWRNLSPHFEGRIQLAHRSLPLEYINRAPTPKAAIESELPYLFGGEPDIPHAPWGSPESNWPVTVMPAFEAVKCAELQSGALADELAWVIRVGFFAHSRCISMRHVLLDLASGTGLNMERFTADFDSGVGKQQVIDEARLGWEEIQVPGSPTWVMPDGTLVSDFGLAQIELDEDDRPSGSTPGLPPFARESALRALIEAAIPPAP